MNRRGGGPILLRMMNGPYARISVLTPHDGDTIGFEAGYARHLGWHQQANDPWSWFGWTVWAGERQRSFVYATFGHSAQELDGAVSPADDEKDNIANVTPHAHFAGSALCEFLPAISRGDGVPAATPRLELTTVDLRPGAGTAFEAQLPAPERETLWFRVLAGGPVPRYLCLRPFPSLTAILEKRAELPDSDAIAKVTVEILSLRPTMCYRVEPTK